MAPVATVSVLVGAAAAAQSFEEWKVEHGKTYNGPTEEQQRLGIFQLNVAFIEAENSKDHTYTLGLNQFSDLTSEEFARTYMGYRRPADTIDAPKMGAHSWAGEELPSSVDWTTQGAVTAIKDQGQCGSCWAFSSTGSLEGGYQLASGQLVELSEQQLMDCSGFPNMGCDGGIMDYGLAYAKDNAICTETAYPYEAKNGKCRASGCSVGLPKGAVAGVKDVAKDEFSSASEKDLMSAVSQQPVSIAIEADKAIFQHYQSGVLTGNCGSDTDHGVLAVGYGTDANGGDYWRVKNSWGTAWGMSGFVLLQRGAGKDGMCGILSGPVYPVMHADVAV